MKYRAIVDIDTDADRTQAQTDIAEVLGDIFDGVAVESLIEYKGERMIKDGFVIDRKGLADSALRRGMRIQGVHTGKPQKIVAKLSAFVLKCLLAFSIIITAILFIVGKIKGW